MINTIEHRHLAVSVQAQQAQREILQMIPGWIPRLDAGFQGRAVYLFVEEEAVFNGKPTGHKLTYLKAVGNDGHIRAYYARRMGWVKEGRVGLGDTQTVATEADYLRVVDQTLKNAIPISFYEDEEVGLNVLTQAPRLVEDPERRVLIHKLAKSGVSAHCSPDNDIAKWALILSVFAHATLYIVSDLFGGEWSQVYGMEPMHQNGSSGQSVFIERAEPGFGWTAPDHAIDMREAAA